MIKTNISKYIKRNRLIIYSFIFNLIITCISYSMFLQMHFSVDSYAIIYNNSGEQYLMQGRVISYVLNNILNVLNINPTLNQQFFTLSLIICISICSTILAHILYDLFDRKSKINFLVINIIICISFSNVFSDFIVLSVICFKFFFLISPIILLLITCVSLIN